MVVIRVVVVVHRRQSHVTTATRSQIGQVQLFGYDGVVGSVHEGGITALGYGHPQQRIVHQFGERVMSTAQSQHAIRRVCILQVRHSPCQHGIRISHPIGQGRVLWHGKGMRGTIVVATHWSVAGTRWMVVVVQLVQVHRLLLLLVVVVSAVEGMILVAVTPRKWHRTALGIVAHRMIVHQTGPTAQQRQRSTTGGTITVHVVVHAAASGETLVTVSTAPIVVALVEVEAGHSHVRGPTERLFGYRWWNGFCTRLVRTGTTTTTSTAPWSNHNLFPFLTLARMHSTRRVRGSSVGW